MNVPLVMDSPMADQVGHLGAGPRADPLSHPGAHPLPGSSSGHGGGVLTPEAFARLTDVSRETLARLERYEALLRKWNRSINLVGASSLRDPWRRHFLDSAQLLPLLPPRPRVPEGRERVLLDLGSGAGFPGLVLAILGAGRVHLCEANRKKATFLREAARETGCRVRVEEGRIEDLAPFPVDVVTARACAPLARVLAYAAPFLGCAGPNPAETGPAENDPAEPGPAETEPAETGPILLVLKGRVMKGGAGNPDLTDSAKLWNMRVEGIASRSDPRATILRFTRRSQEDPRP